MNTPSPTMGGRGPTRVASRVRLLALVLLPLAAACEFPTKAPMFDQKWIIPTDSNAVTVDQMLPANVTTSGNNFVLKLPAIPSISLSYAQMCGAGCPTGSNVPKPSFTAHLTSSAPVDPLVVSANAVSGSMSVTIAHNFSFDPINPSAANKGYIVTLLKNGSTIIGKDSVNGATTTWAANQPLTRTINLVPNSSLVGTLTVDVTIFSPDGNPITVSSNQQITVTVPTNPPATVTINNVKVAVNSKTIASQNIQLKTSDISSDIVNHIQDGSLIFGITNPFGISGTMNAVVTTPTGTINKSITLANTATSTATITFSQAELQQMLGKSNVSLQLSGTVSGPAGGVPVAPGQAIVLTNKLGVTVRIGS